MGTTSNDPVVQAKIMTTVRVDRVMPHGTMPVQPRGIFQHMQDLLLILQLIFFVRVIGVDPFSVRASIESGFAFVRARITPVDAPK